MRNALAVGMITKASYTYTVFFLHQE